MQYLYHLPKDTSLEMFMGLTTLTASAGFLSTLAMTSINPVAGPILIVSNNLAGRYVDCSGISDLPSIDIIKNLAIALFATRALCGLTIDTAISVGCACVLGPLAFAISCCFVGTIGYLSYFMYGIYTDPIRYKVFQEYGLSGVVYFDDQLEIRRNNQPANPANPANPV